MFQSIEKRRNILRIGCTIHLRVICTLRTIPMLCSSHDHSLMGISHANGSNKPDLGMTCWHIPVPGSAVRLCIRSIIDWFGAEMINSDRAMERHDIGGAHNAG